MESGKGNFVDGYTAVQAVQRAAGKNSPPSHPPSPSREQEKEPTTPRTGLHIQRTAMPTKYEVVCYECGYSFQQTGRTQSTQCLKCRTRLDFIDYTIESEWSETLKTAGSVHITADAVVSGGSIIGGNILLEGTVTGGKVEALKKLELAAGAVFPEGEVIGHDLKIPAGADFTFKRKIHHRDVEIFGRLKAKLYAAGVVTIHAEATLQGEVHGAHLVVEEGGGLKAKVYIETPEETKSTAGKKSPKKTT